MRPFLLTHIISAILTFSICLYAWFKPSLQTRNILRISASLSVGSGVLLVADPTHLTRSFCLKLGLYLLFIVLTEYRLTKALSAKI